MRDELKRLSRLFAEGEAEEVSVVSPAHTPGQPPSGVSHPLPPAPATAVSPRATAIPAPAAPPPHPSGPVEASSPDPDTAAPVPSAGDTSPTTLVGKYRW